MSNGNIGEDTVAPALCVCSTEAVTRRDGSWPGRANREAVDFPSGLSLCSSVAWCLTLLLLGEIQQPHSCWNSLCLIWTLFIKPPAAHSLLFQHLHLQSSFWGGGTKDFITCADTFIITWVDLFKVGTDWSKLWKFTGQSRGCRLWVESLFCEQFSNAKKAVKLA